MKNRVTDREKQRDHPSVGPLPRWPKWPVLDQTETESGASSWHPKWVQGPKHLAILCSFPGTLAESLNRSRTVEHKTSSHMQYLHCRLLIFSLYLGKWDFTTRPYWYFNHYSSIRLSNFGIFPVPDMKSTIYIRNPSGKTEYLITLLSLLPYPFGKPR